MDAYEAIKIVMPRIQSLDPVHASKIVCYILMKERGEKEMIRLAFAPEALFTSYINQVKSGLGLLPPPPDGSSSKPSVIIPNNGFHFSSPSNFVKPISYAEVLNGSSNTELLSGQDHLPYLDDTMRDPIVSPSGRSDSLVFPYGEDMNPHPSYPFHRRSFSVNDAAFLSNLEEGGGGWRPCMYFARGFCKNGSSCKFIHSEGSETVEVGSPSGAGSSGFDELLRMKALQQQQKLALMSSGSGGHHPFHYSKCANFLNVNHRNDFAHMAFRAGESSSARQIYLTFPADSTFKEEDVFRYFGKFGPVKDVRIPYQQKRMFGFVTFFYPETVKQILAKGNPHFVCDSRVLVKPYKEKGKVADKKQQQQYLDRGEYSACLSPTGVDSSDLADLPIGPRMLLNTQEMRRRKLEQELELQHVMELQGQRIMNLQLMDMENQQYNSRFISGLSTSLPISSPIQSQLLMGQNAIASPDATHTNIMQEFDEYPDTAKFPIAMADNENFLERTDSSSSKHQHLDSSDMYLLKSNLDHVLPDILFATTGKSTVRREDALLYHNDMLPVTKTTPSNNTDDQASAVILQHDD